MSFAEPVAFVGDNPAVPFGGLNCYSVGSRIRFNPPAASVALDDLNMYGENHSFGWCIRLGYYWSCLISSSAIITAPFTKPSMVWSLLLSI